MTTAARTWDLAASTRRTTEQVARFAHYERILAQIATGVFILEARVPGDADSLEVTFVNEMGAQFFGRTDASTPHVLADAGH